MSSITAAISLALVSQLAASVSLRSSVRNSEFLLAEEVVDNQVQAGCLVAGKDIHCCCVGIQTRIFPYDPWDLEDRLERVETKFVRACAEVGRSSTKLCIQKCSKQRTEIGTRMCYVPMTKDNKPRLSQDFEDWDSHIKNNRKAVTKSFAERMKCFKTATAMFAAGSENRVCTACIITLVENPHSLPPHTLISFTRHRILTCAKSVANDWLKVLWPCGDLSIHICYQQTH